MNLDCGRGRAEKLGVERRIWLCPSHVFPTAVPTPVLPPSPPATASGRTTRVGKPDQEQPGARSRPSFPQKRRLGLDTRPPASALVPAGSALRCSAHEGRRDPSGGPGCQTSGAFHVGRGNVTQVARIQGGAFIPSGSTYLPSTPSTQKRIRTQKTFATLLIYSRFLPLSEWATSCRTPE